MAMQTDDGAVILAVANGRHSARYRGSRWPESWRIAMTFEAAPGPHEWLNEVVAVGIGHWCGQDEIETEIYALS